MVVSIKPVRFFIALAAFILTAFYLLPGVLPRLGGIDGSQDGLPPFPGEENRKDDNHQPLTPPPKVDLINGIPAIGFGTWKASPSVTTDSVEAALAAGYRHIDAAAIYGNEIQVGEAIASSKVPRSDIWITSKLWNDKHARADVRPALEKTLSDLGVSQLDLYLIHWPVAYVSSGSLLTGPKIDPTISVLDTWRAMEDLVRANLTRYIGVSNFAKHDMVSLLKDAHIKPLAHEFETHPYLQQKEFVEWHQKENIAVIAYAPLANTNPTYDSPGVPSILKDKTLLDMAATKNATVAQILLNWGIKRGTIVIPKSTHENRIMENLGGVAVEINDEEMSILAGMDKKLRLSNPSKSWGVDLFSDLDGV